MVATSEVTLLGVGLLDKHEQNGHAWRTASVRRTTSIRLNQTEHARFNPAVSNNRGRYMHHTEMLLVVA